MTSPEDPQVKPSPSPRPKSTTAGTTTQKSPSERITGQPDKAPRKQITHAGATWTRAENPIGFEAATFLKTGVELAPHDEQQTDGVE